MPQTAPAPTVIDGRLRAFATAVKAKIDVVRSDLAGTSSGAAMVGADDGKGGALFTTVAGLVAKLLSSAGSATVGFVQAGGGAVARSVQDKLRDAVSVKDFGAKGDGITDDTAAIQAAINSIAASGGTIDVPEGRYLLSAALQVASAGVRLRGESKGKCELVQENTTEPIINIGANYCEIAELALTYAGTAVLASTAAIVSNGQYTVLRSLVINNPYVGIKFTVSPFQTANDIAVLGYISIGIWLTAVNDIFVSQFVLNANTAANGALGGIRINERVEAFNFTDGEILNGVYPITVDATAYTESDRPAYGQFTNVFFDSAVQAAFVNNCVETAFNRCWFSNGRSGAGNPGCLVGQSDTVSFIDCEFFNSGSHGCSVVNTAKRLSFLNCSFESNSATAGAGAAHGLNIAAGTTDFQIIGGTAHNGLHSGTQGFGIAVAAGASDNFAIVGVNVNGNATGGISDGATGTSRSIANNPGCKTRARGGGTIASGATSVAVPHGLSFTPTQADVLVSPTVNMGACGVSYLWVSAVDATNITVSCNTASAASLGFTWDARTKGV